MMENKITLIDRDTLRRSELAQAFHSTGFKVSAFECGKDAIEHILYNSVSALIVDYSASFEPSSPMADGKRIVEEITNIDAFIPLVLICGRGDVLDQDVTVAADKIFRHPIIANQITHSLDGILAEPLVQRAQRKCRHIYVLR